MHYKSHQSAIESNNTFTIRIEDLIREIVIQNDIPYYRIESSVEHNTHEGAEETYMPIIRVITYFEDTVNKISHILHEEFDVDIEKSVDKKKIRIETFAYKNINYSARLKVDRQSQTVYKRSAKKKFEIQICSMLQDAWGGIEKELGYDKTNIPDEAKRDFYRVGALLEMADIEFLKIRKELAEKLRLAARSQHVVEEPKDLVVDPVATTFVEHLQAVAQPVPQPQVVAQPAPQPQVVAQPAPQPQVVAQPAPQPQVVAQPAPQPQVVAQPAPQPQVVAQPAPQPQVVAQAAQQPIAEPQQPVVAPVAFTMPIAPQRVSQPTPSGIVPKATKIPAPETTVNAIIAKDNVDNLKELAQSINSNIEYKNGAAAAQPAPQPAAVTPPPVQQAPPPPPVAVTPPPPPVVQAPPAPPVQENIVPVVERLVSIPQMPVSNISDISSISVNGNGDVEKNTEIIRETISEKTINIVDENIRPIKQAVAFDENAQMTDASLREFVLSSKLLKEIDQQIAERAGAKINSEVDIEGDVERLRFLKVYTLKQLSDRLIDNKNDIVAFAEKWIGKDNGGSFDSGISLFYLEYLLVGKRNDPAFAVEYVVKFISDNDYSARYIIPTYNSIHNTEAPNFSHLTLRA